MSHTDPDYLAELEKETEFLNAKGRRGNDRIALKEPGESMLLRIVPYMFDDRGKWFARVSRHWISNKPYICTRDTDVAHGGDPDGKCEMCDTIDKLNRDRDKNVSSLAWKMTAVPQYLVMAVPIEHVTANGQTTIFRGNDLKKAKELWLYKESFQDVMTIFKTFLRRTDSKLSIVDPVKGCDLWMSKSRRGLRFDRAEPLPLAPKSANPEDFIAEVLKSINWKPDSPVTSDEMDDLLLKIEDICFDRRSSSRGDDRRGGGGRDDDRRGGGGGRSSRDFDEGRDDRRGGGGGRDDDRRSSAPASRDDDRGSSRRSEPAPREDDRRSDDRSRSDSPRAETRGRDDDRRSSAPASRGDDDRGSRSPAPREDDRRDDRGRSSRDDDRRGTSTGGGDDRRSSAPASRDDDRRSSAPASRDDDRRSSRQADDRHPDLEEARGAGRSGVDVDEEENQQNQRSGREDPETSRRDDDEPPSMSRTVSGSRQIVPPPAAVTGSSRPTGREEKDDDDDGLPEDDKDKAPAAAATEGEIAAAPKSEAPKSEPAARGSSLSNSIRDRVKRHDQGK